MRNQPSPLSISAIVLYVLGLTSVALALAARDLSQGAFTPNELRFFATLFAVGVEMVLIAATWNTNEGRHARHVMLEWGPIGWGREIWRSGIARMRSARAGRPRPPWVEW